MFKTVQLGLSSLTNTMFEIKFRRKTKTTDQFLVTNIRSDLLFISILA